MDVLMPDGTTITGVPDNITQSELLARYQKYSGAQAQAPARQPANVATDVMGNVIGEGVPETQYTPPQAQGIASLQPPKSPSELAPAEEFGKGLQAGATGLQSMWESGKIVKDVGALSTVQERLKKFGQIDSGEITDFDQLRGLDLSTSQARAYLGATPEMRDKMKERLSNELANRKEFVGASIDTIKQYQQEMQKVRGRTVDLTDVDNAKDFANWLSYNVGSGAVQMAPMMLTAAATGPTGLFLVSGSMGVAEATGNRIDALQDKIKDLPKKERADAVINYVKETGDVNLAVGILSGAFDTVLGPDALVAKGALKEVLAGTKKEALKQATKEAAKQMGEEGFTGAAQEVTQLAGAKRVGEIDNIFTEENVKKIINSAAAEAAGAAGPSAVVGGARVYKAGEKEPEREKYTQPEGGLAELMAKQRGFMTPEAARQPAAPAGLEAIKPPEPVAPAAPEAPTPVPTSAAQDYEAMIAELQGKPAEPAPPAAPAVEQVPPTPVEQVAKPVAAADQTLAERIGPILGPARENDRNEEISPEDASLVRKMVVKAVDDGLARGDTRQQIIQKIDALTRGGIPPSGFSRINDYLTEQGVKEAPAPVEQVPPAPVEPPPPPPPVAEAPAAPKLEAPKAPEVLEPTVPAAPVEAVAAAPQETKLKRLEPMQRVDRTIELANEYLNKFAAGDYRIPSRYTANTSAKADDKMAIQQMNNDQDQAYDRAAKQFLEGDLTAKIPSKNQTKINTEGVKGATPKPIEKAVSKKAPAAGADQRKVISSIINDKDIRTYLRGVHVEPEKNLMVATDGHRLVKLEKADLSGLPENPNNYTVIGPDNKWIEGKFPDYNRVIPKHFDNKALVDAKPMGDYARGVARASKYIDQKYPDMRLTLGGVTLAVSPSYVADMTDLFRRFGYDSFELSFDSGRLVATSPDGRITQVIMAMTKSGEVFAAYTPAESTGKPEKKSLAPKPVKKAAAKEEKPAPKEEKTFEQKRDAVKELAGKLLDKGSEQYQETELDGKLYQVKTRTFEGKLYGSEMRLVEDAIGSAKEITLINKEDHTMTLSFVGKHVGEGRNVRIMDSQYSAVQELPKEEKPTPKSEEIENLKSDLADLRARRVKSIGNKAEIDSEIEDLEASLREAGEISEPDEYAEAKKLILEEEDPYFTTDLKEIEEGIYDKEWVAFSGEPVYGKSFRKSVLIDIKDFKPSPSMEDVKAAIDDGKEIIWVERKNLKEAAPAVEAKADLDSTAEQAKEQKHNAVVLFNRQIPVVLSKHDQKRNMALVPVSVKEFDAGFVRNEGQYIGEGGEGGIGKRYENFGKFALMAKNIEASNVAVDERGVVTFGDGRHRYAVMRDQGFAVIPVAMDAESFANAKKAGYIAEDIEVLGPIEPAPAPAVEYEPYTIDGEFRELGEEDQFRLLTDQTVALDEKDISALEEHYGEDRFTPEFLERLRSDVIDFVNKGAQAVDKAIRKIIQQVANGVLAVAIVFNPQFINMPRPVAIPQTETIIEKVEANVPQEVAGRMSDDAKRAYAVLYPALKTQLQEKDKFMVIVDKQMARTFVFRPDGTPLIDSKVLISKGIGDFYKGDNNIDANKITPAGLFDLGLRDAKRSPAEAATAGEYDFGKVFVMDKAGMGKEGPYSITIMHSVWLHEKDAKQRAAALTKEGPEDSRYSFGCINVDKDTYGYLVNNYLSQMDGAKLFIVPEKGKDVMSFINGEATYTTDVVRQRITPMTSEREVPVRGLTSGEISELVADRNKFMGLYNIQFPGLNPATNADIDRDGMIAKYAKLRQRRAQIIKEFEKGKAGISQQSELTMINEFAAMLKEDIDASRPARRSAKNFFTDATKAWDQDQISDDVHQVIEKVFQKFPWMLEGLKLSVRKGREGAAGEFGPLNRLVYLYKGTNGVEDPSTIRHEIVHSLEQMMSPEAAKKVVDEWEKKLDKLIRSNKDPKVKEFLDALIAFYAKPSLEAWTDVMMKLPSYEYYQYVNPSEYWAVNAEKLLAAKLGGAWDKFKLAVRRLFEGFKNIFGFDNNYAVHRAFNDILSGNQERFTSSMLKDYVGAEVAFAANINKVRNYKGDPAPMAQWASPNQSKMDDFLYRIADKHVDLKRVQQEINKKIGEIDDRWDAYMKEELYHGRTAKRTNDYLENELRPFVVALKDKGVTLAEFEEYLHNRHAEEANKLIAERNPSMPDAGSGMTTEEARKYLNDLSADKRKKFEDLAKMVDSMVKGTQKILVDNGLETQETIDAWNKAYKHYVPLQRADLDFIHHGTGLGAGFQTKGAFAKNRTGSLREVIDIMANLALQRERAIVRAEKARVGRALYGLAITNPNPKFWLPINPDAIKSKKALIKELTDMGMSPDDAENLIQEPRVARIVEVTDEEGIKQKQVKYQINPSMRNSDNVFAVRINGQERYVFFNPQDPRAKRMAEAIKNLDAEQLGTALGTVAKVTRFIASVNTQYNPVFGAWNFARDVQGAAFNLASTPIADMRGQVVRDSMPALKAIYQDLRGKEGGSKKWKALWERFQEVGGQTGYREQFAKDKEKERANVIQKELEHLDRGNFRKAADAVFQWLSDYNDSMENAIRLAAFKAALDKGLSEERAASIAKNLTVNFNRKGQSSGVLGALYAFFNASVQGTMRMAELLKSPAGKKIMAGGFIIGVAQSIALALAGFDDDEPPEFLKNKNLIIPIGDGKYVIVPMPLGLNVFPNLGRLMTEYILGEAGAISGGKGAGDKLISAMAMILDAFNPLGTSGIAQVMSPTVTDPIIAVATNKDAFGRPISKEDRATQPTPGYTRSKATASTFSQGVAYFLNYVSGGGEYGKGKVSPTADDIDYLIGQYTGGVGREIMKTVNLVTKPSGEDTPSYKIPIVGKLYGETGSPSAVADKFYKNVTMLAEHEDTMKRMRKDRENVSEYRAEHPEVKYIAQANNLENQISNLNRTIKMEREKEQTDSRDERIKRLMEQKTRMMDRFNQKIKDLQLQ